MDKNSYALGMSIAHNLLQSGINELETSDFADGLQAVLTGAEPKVSFKEAGEILDKFFAKIEAEQKAKSAAVADNMKAEGKAWLKENASKEGVCTTDSGLQYKALTSNAGKKPKATSKVKCHYEGRFISGEVFDSSYKRGEPAVFGLNQVIPGWTEGLQLMSVGDKYEFYIPYQLGYGEQGAPGAIPPCSTLIFTVELLDILA